MIFHYNCKIIKIPFLINKSSIFSLILCHLIGMSCFFFFNLNKFNCAGSLAPVCHSRQCLPGCPLVPLPCTRWHFHLLMAVCLTAFLYTVLFIHSFNKYCPKYARHYFRYWVIALNKTYKVPVFKEQVNTVQKN